MMRPAHPEETEAVRQLVVAVYSHYITRLGKPPGPMLDDYSRRIAEEQVWLLEDGGELVGVLVLENAGGGTLLIDNVAVSPPAQGKGHGQELIAFAEQEARQRGCAELQLYTHVLMSENIAFYRRRGFHETGRVTEKGYDRVYMAKRLAQLPE